ncbi:MAG: hypothetical protein NC226_09515 [Bacteroides cellulosilyticus]|nr:hypothetical protein [Bacteroides cellulosilyticus]
MSRYSFGLFAEKTNAKTYPMKLPCGWKVCIIIIAVVAIIAFVIAICKSYPRTKFCIDYVDIIVAIFSILVTLLVGWQIFNLIKIDRLKHDLTSIQINIKKLQTKINEETNELGNQLRSEICLNRSLSWSMRGRYNVSLKYIIKGLEFQNKCKEQSEELIEFADGLFTHQEYSWLTKEQHNKLIELLHNSKAEGSLDLLTKIAKITFSD